ncbi:MAG: Dabb family protein [Bacteroidales bacterium]
MIKHIVLFRIVEAGDIDHKKARAAELNDIFSPLSDLECVKEFRTGINFNPAVSAWDFVIDSLFDSREKLEEYQVSKRAPGCYQECLLNW